MTLALFLWQCFKAYRRLESCQTNTVVYFAAGRYGVPRVTAIIARDRGAWAVSDFATRYFIQQGGNGDVDRQ